MKDYLIQIFYYDDVVKDDYIIVTAINGNKAKKAAFEYRCSKTKGCQKDNPKIRKISCTRLHKEMVQGLIQYFPSIFIKRGKNV